MQMIFLRGHQELPETQIQNLQVSLFFHHEKIIFITVWSEHLIKARFLNEFKAKLDMYWTYNIYHNNLVYTGYFAFLLK